jgi:hypothetical protein
MFWVQEVDGNFVAQSGDREFVVSHIFIPYPKGAKPGLKLACGWFWELTVCDEDGPTGPPRHFDRCEDAKRFVDRHVEG